MLKDAKQSGVLYRCLKENIGSSLVQEGISHINCLFTTLQLFVGIILFVIDCNCYGTPCDHRTPDTNTFYSLSGFCTILNAIHDKNICCNKYVMYPVLLPALHHPNTHPPTHPKNQRNYVPIRCRPRNHHIRRVGLLCPDLIRH